jgi:hypothetical protein
MVRDLAASGNPIVNTCRGLSCAGAYVTRSTAALAQIHAVIADVMRVSAAAPPLQRVASRGQLMAAAETRSDPKAEGRAGSRVV